MIHEINDSQPLQRSQAMLKRSNTSQKTASETQAANFDKIELGQDKSTKLTYRKSDYVRSQASTIEAMQKQAEKTYENLRSLIEKLLAKQGYASAADAFRQGNLKADQKTIDAAKQSISDDGEYGVEAVSSRIVDFAIAISGGDKEKFAELKAAIDQGFAEAEKVWGGALPGICQKTYGAVMSKLDKWQQDEQ